jgi:hypothetical protein
MFPYTFKNIMLIITSNSIERDFTKSYKNIFEFHSYVKKHFLDNVSESIMIIGNFMYCNVAFVLYSLYVKDSINRIIFVTCFQVVNIMSLYFSQQKWKDY